MWARAVEDLAHVLMRQSGPRGRRARCHDLDVRGARCVTMEWAGEHVHLPTHFYGTPAASNSKFDYYSEPGPNLVGKRFFFDWTHK